MVVALLSPTIVRLTSPTTLQSALQASQNESTLVTPGPGIEGAVGIANSNNLALEPVNFSSRAAIIKNLPLRIRDLLLKPYPWQLGGWSQRFGAIGSLIAIAMLLILIRYAWRSRGTIFRRTAPLLYPTLMMLVAFALSDGNAGTGFHYRAHLLIPAFGMLSVLWVARREGAPAHEPRAMPAAYSRGSRDRLGC